MKISKSLATGLCILVIVLLLRTSHNVTCRVWIVLCSEWWSNIDLLVSTAFSTSTLVTLTALDKIPKAPAVVSSSVSSSQCPKSKISARPAKPRWMILLSSQKSGSTWTQQKLNSHPKVTLGNERLMDFSRSCNGKCSWEETRGKIEEIMVDYSIRYSRDSNVVGFNIQYDQIPDPQRRDFAEWVHCNGVGIIHLIKSASIESFWTMQAQLYDTVQLKEYVDTTTHTNLADKLKSNQVGITVDPLQASKYVINLEAVRKQFRDLLHFHPRGIHYMELFYEDLLLPSADLYWRAAQSFLGVNPTNLASRLMRLHPGSCQSKIPNYESAVRSQLKGTTSELACHRVYHQNHQNNNTRFFF